MPKVIRRPREVSLRTASDRKARSIRLEEYLKSVIKDREEHPFYQKRGVLL